MRHVDFSPLYRSTVGFDRLFTMLDSLAQPDSAQTYPPYNIERTGEDAYRISMAVAGFSDERHRHRGAPQRADASRASARTRPTAKAPKCSIAASPRAPSSAASSLPTMSRSLGAELKNGLLHIDLKRNVPEELKPRKIAISAPTAKRQADRGQGRA